jgi:DNA adenine methylase
MNAPFRYHGSKWRMWSVIQEYMTPHTVYTESFGGSGCILLQKPVTGIEVYNDLDADLYNFFAMLRNRRDELLQALAATPYSRQMFEEVDEAKRQGRWPTEPIERALYFFVLTGQGWGGKKNNGRRSWRKQNLAGSGVPQQAWAWANAPERLVAVADRLRHVFIENRPALDVLRSYDGPDALHYVDPPYPPSTRVRPDHGYDYEMPSDDQHIELLECCLSLRGHVIISGMDHPVYNRMLASWHRREVQSRTAAHERVTTEVLWISPRFAQPTLFALGGGIGVNAVTKNANRRRC